MVYGHLALVGIGGHRHLTTVDEWDNGIGGIAGQRSGSDGQYIAIGQGSAAAQFRTVPRDLDRAHVVIVGGEGVTNRLPYGIQRQRRIFVVGGTGSILGLRSISGSAPA